MSRAEEAWEAPPEESQAGGASWVEGFTNKATWCGIAFFFLTSLFISSNIDGSAPPYISDKMAEEEDDAYDFSTDYV